MIDFDISKYRELFLEECEELFAEIDEILLSIEKKSGIDDKEIKDIFRHIHTIKGGAASVELMRVSKFTHEFETFLDKLRNKEITFRPEMADVFIASADMIKELISEEMAAEITEESFRDKTESLLLKISDLSSGKIVEKEEQKPKGYGFFDDFWDEPEKTAPQVAENITDKEENQEQEPSLLETLSKELELPIKESFQNEIKNVEAPPPPTGVFASMSEAAERAREDGAQKAQKQTQSSSMSIRVDLSKIDVLMNNIGELVIDMSMLSQYIDGIGDLAIKNVLSEKAAIFSRHVREFQESVMGMRMVPMESIYAKFPKTIRDVAKKLNKQIEFKSFGNSVEIDKAMIEGLNDPLMHIIRNSCDHGIELAEDRVKAGKAAIGTITIGAEQANGQIMISVIDDGKGIDYEAVAKKAFENGVVSKERLAVMTPQEKTELIFEPGLSTAKSITEVSGRGVGMDVVKNNIQKLGGSVKIESQIGKGSVLTISLPLTLAILDGLNITVGDSKFILPLASIVESLQPTEDMIKKLGDGSEETLLLREEAIPIIRLHRAFNIEPAYNELTKGMLIVTRSVFGKAALFVDMFLNQQQVVIKPIDKNFRAIKGVSGATVRGDGAIGLILDVSGIIELHKEFRRSA